MHVIHLRQKKKKRYFQEILFLTAGMQIQKRSFMFIRDGKYYFMWSEGGWTGPDYRVAYAISDSPFGPFEREGVILEQDDNIGRGAGHHSVLKIPETDDFYIVYHRRPLEESDRNHRVTCIDKMEFDENGKILPVTMTFEGVPARPLK
ncbi:MAG: family 43 glycosylhydrolase [Cyclobacteriaceae bacterium]